MELNLDDSQQSFKSSENSFSSVSGKISKRNTLKTKKDQKNETQISKKEKGNAPKPIVQKNKFPQVNIANILYNQRSITKLMKNIFRRILDVNCTKQSYDLFLEKLSPTDFKFYDNLFPPNLNSLIKGYKKYDNQNTNINQNKKKQNEIIDDPLLKYKNVIWKRESEMTDYPDIFPKNGILAQDIVNGKYTNENFLSAIGALAEFPKIIKNLFISDKKNKNCIFGIKICKDGFLQEVVIDDYFPVNKDDDTYCFTHSKDDSLWVQIIEKAYAKVYGSYELLRNKGVEGILKDLSYAPVLVLDSLSTDLAQNLTLANDNKWITMASAGDTDASLNLLEELELKPNFAYEILEVFKLESDDLDRLNNFQTSDNNIENFQIILKIRNIWGKIEWLGDWSNSYKFWTDDLKRKMKFVENDEQSFYMNLRDFKHHFCKVKICKYLENFKYKSIKIRQRPNTFALIKIKMYKPNVTDSTSNCFISLIQEEKEKYENDDNNSFFISRMILCKIDDIQPNEVHYIKGKMGQEREIFIEQKQNFSGGEFLLFSELDKITEITNYVISVYSSEEVEIQEIPNYTYPNILEKIYISCAKIKKVNKDNSINDISINNYNDYSNNNENNNYRSNSFKKILIKKAPKIIKYTESTVEGYSYIYIENNEDDITLIEDVNYKNFDGYSLLPPYSGGRFHVEVKPGESKIVLIKRLDLIESNNNIVFYRSNLFYGRETLLKLTKKKGIKKQRVDKETGKEVDINVYIFKHDFGVCYLYRNKTNNMTLKEKVNIENNKNIEIIYENKNKENDNDLDNIIDVENQKEIKIELPPQNDYFLDLRSRCLLWKVNPVFTYTIEKLPNVIEEGEEEKNEIKEKESRDNSQNDSNDENKDNNDREFFTHKKEDRSRSLRTNSPSSIRNENVENYNDINENNEEEKKESDKENENLGINDSFEKAGDSSDVSMSSNDDKSEEST